MIAWKFRFINHETSKPTGYYGIAAARNIREMFWQIDVHGDPYSVEILPIEHESVCWKEAWSEDECEASEYEHDVFACLDDLWKKPEWPSSEYLECS